MKLNHDRSRKVASLNLAVAHTTVFVGLPDDQWTAEVKGWFRDVFELAR